MTLMLQQFGIIRDYNFLLLNSVMIKKFTEKSYCFFLKYENLKESNMAELISVTQSSPFLEKSPELAIKITNL